MINWTFYINGTQVDEPKGFNDVVLKLSRDENWHGIFFEASTSALVFYGAGAALLTAEKDSNGLAASATFTAQAECGETIDLLETTFNFGTYIERCGNTCAVEIHLEKSGCIMAMKNRYDQPVDMQKTTAFNNATLLQQYTGLDLSMSLLAQEILLIDEASNGPDVIAEIVSDSITWTPDAFNDYFGYLAPAFPLVLNSSLGTFSPSSIIDLTANGEGGASNPPLFPNWPTTIGTATLISNAYCDLLNTELYFRLKGGSSIAITDGLAFVNLIVKVFRLPVGLDGNNPVNWVVEYNDALVLMGADGVYTWDKIVTVPLTISQGDFLFFGLYVAANLFDKITYWTFSQDAETTLKLTTGASCPPTTSDVSLINEFGSRLVESITDGCLRMKSDYYGRTDSEPYASDIDGCGSLRMLTNGLKIRNATTNNHFLSLKGFYDSLKAIDNIGIGLESNPNIPNSEWLRIEPAEYFFQNVLLLTLTSIPDFKRSLQPDMGVSKINIGYKNWELEKINGLGEFNTNKIFRTSLSTIEQELDLLSDFVAGGIPIESTRLQSFAGTGAADTTFDNKTFIICVERSGYDFIVEKGNISSAANIFSPLTTYNWRLRPFYNLMRWFKSLAQTYVNLNNSASKLFFVSGTGNYIAEGMLGTYDDCRIENKVLAENDNLSKNDFEDSVDATPLFMPETINFVYPMSIADYLIVKANPYGYLNIQCGSGNFEKAYIKNIDYKPAAGEATFTLITRWP